MNRERCRNDRTKNERILQNSTPRESVGVCWCQLVLNAAIRVLAKLQIDHVL